MSNPLEIPVASRRSHRAEIHSNTITREGELRGFGKKILHRIETDDRYVYDVSVGIPDRAITDSPVIIGTPWMMHTAGLPGEMARRSLELGFPTVLVGPEQNLSRLPSLSVSAHNLHAIADTLGERYGHNQREVVSTGMSRAAMLGITFASAAEQYDREVVYGDWIAPCFPSHPSITSPLHYWQKFPGEAMSLARLAASGQFANFWSSFDGSLPGIVQASLSAPGLVNGEVGKSASTLPEKTNATVTVFSSDIMSDAERWQEIFKRYPDIFVNVQRGGHSELGDRHTFNEWSARLATVASILEFGNKNKAEETDHT